MSIFIILLISIVLGVLHLNLTTTVQTFYNGLNWNKSPRDTEPPPLPVEAARFVRSLENFKETYPFFLAAILLNIVLKLYSNFDFTADHISVYAGALYLVARVIYIPLYIYGIVGWRSLVWLCSFVGILGLLFVPIKILLF